MEHSYEDTRGPWAGYKMKKRPKHLPREKLEELNRVVREIRNRHAVEMIAELEKIRRSLCGAVLI